MEMNFCLHRRQLKPPQRQTSGKPPPPPPPQNFALPVSIELGPATHEIKTSNHREEVHSSEDNIKNENCFRISQHK